LTETMTDSRAKLKAAARLLTAVFAAVLVLAVSGGDADARRMGGGKSFGRQAAPSSPPPARSDLGQPSRPAQAAPAQPASPQGQPGRNRWLGPLTGLAAGLGIAALLSHFGLMGPFAELLGSALVIGLLVIGAMLIWRMLRGGAARPMERRMEPAYNAPGPLERPSASSQRAAMAGSGQAQPGSVAATMGDARTADDARPLDDARTLGSAAPGPVSVIETRRVPANFDGDGFLRNAKVHFLRLQAAWDRKDLNDLSEFTTPEVFAELRMQIAEEQERTNHTDVEKLDAQLLGVDEGLGDWLASVRFTGAIRENAQAAPEAFEEIWNLSKPKDGRTGWLLAGIQQVTPA
jgi:predicted lipid-binding transport protein (Tim44 family)